MPTASTPLLPEVWTLFRKDWRAELRSKVAVNSILLFALITLALVSYSIGPYRIPPQEKPAVLSAWLTIILFFTSMTGLSRVFVKEEESRTAETLRLAARPEAVFLGKLLFNLCLMAGVTAVVVPLYGLLMEFQILHVCSFYGIIALSMVGLTIASTLIAAIISKAGMKGALFPILSFPLLLPILLETSLILAKAAAYPDLGWLPEALGILTSYAGLVFIASILLFERVWNA
jgi:heme exporter protein B